MQLFGQEVAAALDPRLAILHTSLANCHFGVPKIRTL